MGKQTSVNLDVFVEKNCRPCDHAKELAARVQRRFPGVQVRLVDLSLPASERPDTVFAVPTYILNGELLCLGNPEEEDLVQVMQSAIDDDSPVT